MLVFLPFEPTKSSYCLLVQIENPQVSISFPLVYMEASSIHRNSRVSTGLVRRCFASRAASGRLASGGRLIDHRGSEEPPVTLTWTHLLKVTEPFRFVQVEGGECGPRGDV